MITCSISFIMLACIINEERYKPAKPVVTNTVSYIHIQQQQQYNTKSTNLFIYRVASHLEKTGHPLTPNSHSLGSTK